MKYSLSDIKDANLHDYELKIIEIDYFNKRIIIELVSPEHEVYNIMINEFFHFSINCIEPWGEGMYIYSLEVLNDCMGLNGSLVFKLLLNSGDELIIHTKEMVLEHGKKYK